jgi:hypothetical protein
MAIYVLARDAEPTSQQAELVLGWTGAGVQVMKKGFEVPSDGRPAVTVEYAPL